MHRFRHLVVGLPRSTASGRELISYAARLARLGAFVEVHFLHVLAPCASRGAAKSGLDFYRTLAQVETEVAAHFLEVPPQVRVRCTILKGTPLDALMQFAQEHEADLILIGHRSGSPSRHRLARRLVRSAPCSVWMVPGGADREFRRILVPIDFSAAAADALEVAAAIAERAGGAQCIALHVERRDLDIAYEPGKVVVDFRKADQAIRVQNEAAYRRFIEPIQTHGVDVVGLFEVGSRIETTILRTAAEQQADLVVMSSHGRTRWASLLHHCVAEETIGESQLPLLVVKHFGARRGILRTLWDRASHFKAGQ